MLEAAVLSRSAAALKVLLTHPELARQAASPARFGIIGLDQNNETMSLARRAASLDDATTVTALTEIASVRQFEAASNNPYNLAAVALHSGNRALFDYLCTFPELHRLLGLCTVTGFTPLMLAVWADDAGLFAQLLQMPEVRATVMRGPETEWPTAVRWPVNFQQEKIAFTDVLELAIRKEQAAMVGALLQVRQVIDAIHTQGDYARHLLLLLITRNMAGPLAVLLQYPIIAKIACIADSDGKTALHHAAHRGRHDVIQLLLGKLPAKEINRIDRANKTAADLARESGHGELAEFLTSVARVRRVMGIQ